MLRLAVVEQHGSAHFYFLKCRKSETFIAVCTFWIVGGFQIGSVRLGVAASGQYEDDCTCKICLERRGIDERIIHDVKIDQTKRSCLQQT